MQMYWHLSLLPSSSSQSGRDVLVYNHDLYCPKLTLENDQIPTGNLQVKETLETSAGPSSGIDDSHTSTTHYTAYCMMTLKRWLPLEEKPLDSTTTRSHEHYIIDRMIESYFIVCHVKRHRRNSKRLMTVYAELTNLV